MGIKYVYITSIQNLLFANFKVDRYKRNLFYITMDFSYVTNFVTNLICSFWTLEPL